MSHGALIGLLFLSATAFTCPAAEVSGANVHHDLELTLHLKEKRISGIDRMTINPADARPFSFVLSDRATVKDAAINGGSSDFQFSDGMLVMSPPNTRRTGPIEIKITYQAPFDDQVPERPVNTDNPGYGVMGVISDRGCFLQGGAGWYPGITEAESTYSIRVDAPAGILAVTAGKCLGHSTRNGRTISLWDVHHPVEGLSLSAGPYVLREMDLQNAKVFTYLFPENDHLAESYLRASAKYILMYESLFGPYPFDKFAVVENFFPTGYGFPSYTVLGSRVLRLPFIIHTSLGHEIAHCWWGNGVYVDPSQGNWSEGLTTYVADHLLKEQASQEKAIAYRRQILRDYATLVKSEADFPLSRFQSRYDPVSKTIGYGKAAMVFHMLRQRLGEDIFWGGLRDLYGKKLFKRATWDDFKDTFERRAKHSLKRFFDQWIYRKGGPLLTLEDVARRKSYETWEIGGRITQRPPFYDLRIPLAVDTLENKQIEQIHIKGETTPFTIQCPASPKRISVDPNFDIFRRLHASEFPPSINSIKASPRVVVILSETFDPLLREAIDTVRLSLGLENTKLLKVNEVSTEDILDNDILFMGMPEGEHFFGKMPDQLVIKKDGFSLLNRSYTAPSDTLFAVMDHPFSERHVLALFLPLSSQYAVTVAEKLGHYGHYSYLAFTAGQNQVKGTWPIPKSPLIYGWADE